jgi:hypothetical protein
MPYNTTNLRGQVDGPVVEPTPPQGLTFIGVWHIGVLAGKIALPACLLSLFGWSSLALHSMVHGAKATGLFLFVICAALRHCHNFTSLSR